MPSALVDDGRDIMGVGIIGKKDYGNRGRTAQQGKKQTRQDRKQTKDNPLKGWDSMKGESEWIECLWG